MDFDFLPTRSLSVASCPTALQMSPKLAAQI